MEIPQRISNDTMDVLEALPPTCRTWLIVPTLVLEREVAEASDVIGQLRTFMTRLSPNGVDN